MKSAKFKYYDPETPEEVLSLLKEYGSDCKILAGGQSLLPMLNLRVLSPEVIVDINRVTQLSGYSIDGNGGLNIGAMTRHKMLEDDPEMFRVQPLVASAIPLIAHRAVRCRGTIGGSLSHADPSAEWGALVQVLDATMVCRHTDGDIRYIPADEFFVDLMETALEPEDLLTEIRLPKPPEHAGFGIAEFSRRHGDLALTGVACMLRGEASGHCIKARIAIFGVEEIPRRLLEIEALLSGEKLTDKLISMVAGLVADFVDPMDDPFASADYRKHLATAMTEQAIQQAVQGMHRKSKENYPA